MNKETFWQIIDNARNSGIDPNDQTAMLNATEKELLNYPSQEIAAWHRIQYFYHKIAYRRDLWAACTATKSHDTDDGFIDFRSWLISQGREVYLRALHDPDSLADLDFPEGVADFEAFGYVAHGAYAMKAALESQDLKSILYDCCAWSAENAAQIYRDCEAHHIDEAQKKMWLVERYVQELSQKFYIYTASMGEPLDAETNLDIFSEIHLGPDIDWWEQQDLPHIVPRLYEKYCVEAGQGYERSEDD